MKNLSIIISIIISSFVTAQITIEKTVAIGSEAASAPANGFVSIEFGNATGGVKGVILPWVTSQSAVTGAVPGTFIFDSTDQKIKLATAATADATSATDWIDLSKEAAKPTTYFKNNVALSENDGAKTIIGNPTSTAPGILVLETPNPATAPKAMILPRVNAYTDIVNPSAGMMVYVTSTKTFAVFNGKEWTFWK